MTATESPELHALVVGIDHYPEPPSGGFAYHHLAGAVRDALRVESYLREALEVPAERVTRLLAPHRGGEPSQRPTYARLVAALGELEAACRPGEQALVYYSGHGGRAPTLVPEIKGSGRIDEVLVPADVGDPSVPYLHDVELAAWLARLAARGTFVTVILDCCHSGGMPRTNRRVRGSSNVDRTPRPAGRLVTSRAELAAVWREETVERRRDGLELVPVRAQLPTGCVVLAACRPLELAVEVEREGGEWTGVLTDALLTALERSDGPALTYRRLHGTVTARLHAAGFLGQTPVIDGEIDRLVLGRERLPAHRGAEVLEVVESWLGNRVRLSAGSVHGVRRGARFALTERAAAVSSPGAAAAAPALAEVEVVEVEQGTSWATFTAGAGGPRPVRAGDAANLVDPGSSAFRRTVGWANGGGEAENDRWSWLAALLAGHGDRFLTPAPAGAAGDFEVAEEDGALVIRDAGGAPIPHLGRPISPDDPGAGRELVRRLAHLARYWSVRSLENPDPLSPLAGVLRLRVERVPGPEPSGGTVCGGSGPAGSPFLSLPPGDVVEVPPGAHLRVVIENEGYRELDVAILDLQPDWGIQQVYPHRDAAPWATLEPGIPIAVELLAHLPDGLSEGVDVLKAIAATEPFDLASLECPALRAPRDPLRGGDGCRGAAVRADTFGGAPAQSWTTATLALRVARPADVEG